MFALELCDDDGVLVLASALALKRRFASRELDYEYPRELLRAAGDEELCFWQTNEEDDVRIVIRVGKRPVPDARFIGVLGIQAGDELLAMPYSQYTMACDRGGVPEDIEGLCARIAVDPGRYACWVRPASVEAVPDGEDEAPLAFDVYLVAAAATDKPLGEVPLFER